MTAKMQDGFWLGVDVGKFTVEACVAPRDSRTSEWAKLRVASFAHDQDGIRALGKWLAAALAQGPCLGVCIEPTSKSIHGTHVHDCSPRVKAAPQGAVDCSHG